MFDRNCFFIQNEYGKIGYYNNDQEMVRQISSNLFFEQEYVENVLKPYIESAEVVLDIGAHCGSHTIMYKKINPDCKVFSFEPQKKIYDLLEYNVVLNGLDGVVCMNVAVGDSLGFVELNDFSSDGDNAFASLNYGDGPAQNLAGVQIGAGGERVEIVPIDSLGIEACDFIKVDVEGYEPKVLRGACRLIERFRPTISYEFNHKTSGDPETSYDILESLGYECKNVWGDNWLATPID